MIRKSWLPLLAVALLGYATVHVMSTLRAPGSDGPAIEPAHTPFANAVAGAGIVEAQTENIAIGSALPGVVLKVHVPIEKVGQWVKAGDPLFRVDDRQLRAQLRVQEANLTAAVAQLAKLEAEPRSEEVLPSEAAVRTAQANFDMQSDIARRNLKLYRSGAVSEEDYLQRRLAAQSAWYQFQQAKTRLAWLKAGAWDKDKAIARAAVEQARALLEQTRTDLDRALVRAPVDGQVIQVKVRPGEYVGTPPGQPLVVLGNLKRLHVRVDIDEHDIPRFTPGAPARATQRSRPQSEYPLTFVRVEPYVIPKRSLTGDSKERTDTRVLQVIYALDPGDSSLYVGQLLDVFIHGDEQLATAGRAHTSAGHTVGSCRTAAGG